MLITSIVLFGEDWNNECTAPDVFHGDFDSTGWSDLKDGDNIDGSKIQCSSGFHKLGSEFRCSCGDDGEACKKVNACMYDLCSIPLVEDGSFQDDTWSDQQNGTVINGTIECNSGYTRSSNLNFICICGSNNASCEELKGACIAENPVGNDDGDNGSQDNDDRAILSDSDDSSSNIPAWLMAFLIIGDILACILLVLACYLCYDYKNKKQAEEYWNNWNAQRPESMQKSFAMSEAKPRPPSMGNIVMGDVPVAITVNDYHVKVTATAVPDDKDRKVIKNPQQAARDSARDSMSKLEDGKAAANAAVAADNAGKSDEAIRLYEMAIRKLTTGIEGLPSTDKTFTAAIKIDKYKVRVSQLRQS